MNQHKSAWAISDTIAQISVAEFQATLDFAKPGEGLQYPSPSQSPNQTCRLFALGPEHLRQIDSASECYVRGDDLVVTYPIVEPDEVQPQIYWRAIAPSGQSAGGCEVIVSMHTRRLDANPLVSLTCDLPCPVIEEPDTRYPGLYVAAASETFHLAIMVHPTDYCQSSLQTSEDNTALSYDLFQSQLEKGVIRRGRARCLFVPASTAQASARELYEMFAATQPPLTT